MYQEKIALNNPEEFRQQNSSDLQNDYFESLLKTYNKHYQVAIINALRQIYYTGGLGDLALEYLKIDINFPPVVAAVFDEVASIMLNRPTKTPGMIEMNRDPRNELIFIANTAAARIGFYCDARNKEFHRRLEKDIIYGNHKETDAIEPVPLLARQAIYRLDRQLLGQLEARRKLDGFINQHYPIDRSFPKLFTAETNLRAVAMVTRPFKPERLFTAGDRVGEILSDIGMPTGLPEEIKAVVIETIKQSQS